MTQIQQDLKTYLLEQGASDVGFCCPPDGDFGDCKNAVSVVVHLSDAIVDEIGAEPTHTYFNHYRSVNAFIDALLLKAGLFLQKRGYRYITVAASQSINKNGWNYTGRYSHKKAAVLSGLGTIGKLHGLPADIDDVAAVRAIRRGFDIDANERALCRFAAVQNATRGVHAGHLLFERLNATMLKSCNAANDISI